MGLDSLFDLLFQDSIQLNSGSDVVLGQETQQVSHIIPHLCRALVQVELYQLTDETFTDQQVPASWQHGQSFE